MANIIISLTNSSDSTTTDGYTYKDVNMTSEKNFKSLSEQSLMKYKVSSSIDIDAVKNNIKNIFTWVPGERILNPEFGSRLYEYLYNGITTLNQENIIAEINHCFSTWEPRALVKQILNASTVDDTENNTIHLKILYTIKELEPDSIFEYDYILNTNK